MRLESTFWRVRLRHDVSRPHLEHPLSNRLQKCLCWINILPLKCGSWILFYLFSRTASEHMLGGGCLSLITAPSLYRLFTVMFCILSECFTNYGNKKGNKRHVPGGGIYLEAFPGSLISGAVIGIAHPLSGGRNEWAAMDQGVTWGRGCYDGLKGRKGRGQNLNPSLSGGA